MVLEYSTIIETVEMRFPEIHHCSECRKVLELIEGSDDLPYVFFQVFWTLLETTLTSREHDAKLLEKIFSFMEEMAESNDTEVVNLMQIEMLEPLFGLDYDIYHKVVKKHLLPKSLMLHKAHLPYFKEPEKNVM